MENTSSGNNIDFSYLVFFDLDRTITASVSGRALALMAYRQRKMSLPVLLSAVSASVMHRLKLRDPARTIGSMASWTKGLEEKVFTGLCNDVTDKVLIPAIYEEARTEIAKHRANRAKIILLSSAVRPVCTRIASHLGIGEVICSDLEVSEDRLTGKPAGQLCYGSVKAEKMKEYCEKNNSTPSESFYYGDSFSDLSALELSGNPVCVNPERSLGRIAQKKGWKILKWTNFS